MITGVADASVVVREAGRLLWRHWPVLLVIFLLGAAVHNGALWLAVVASRSNAWVGALLVPVAPLATLVALIFMLRAVSPSLRFGAPEEETAVEQALPAEPGEGGRTAPGRAALARRAWRLRSRAMNTRLRLLAATLVPFMTVYAVQGYLTRDRDSFLNSAVADEQRTASLSEFDLTGRFAFINNTTMTLAVVGIALVVRWLFDAFDLPERGTGWGLAAAWVEATWLTWLAGVFTSEWSTVREWVTQRVFVDWLIDLWATVTGWLGPLGPVVESVRLWLGGLVGNLDVLVVIPIAWLTIGAVAYSRQLQRAPTHELPAALAGRIGGRLSFLPSWARGWLAHPFAALTSRFSGLWNGIRTLALAGLVPMLLFCLVFLLVQQAEVGLANLLRVVIGPRDYDDMISLSPYLDTALDAVGTLLEVALLAAAIDRILVRQDLDQQARTEAGDASSAAEPTVAGQWVQALRSGAQRLDAPRPAPEGPGGSTG